MILGAGASCARPGIVVKGIGGFRMQRKFVRPSVGRGGEPLLVPHGGRAQNKGLRGPYRRNAWASRSVWLAASVISGSAVALTSTGVSGALAVMPPVMPAAETTAREPFTTNS